MEYITHSVEETENLASKLAKKLKGTEVIAFFGGLGMGKTAFTRGLCKGLNYFDGVQSPTFSLVNQYNADYTVYHFDMYRINTYDDLYSTGFFDYLDTGILVIEWSENIENALPDDYISVEIEKGENDDDRIIKIEGIEL
ncbi:MULTISPECIES: tRNA (adenosine(37)-N6)-threonylcarbamoyltransferase complex ATPase subunit type 1 TsaE [Ruminococcus]|uniref:tRNA threonylcarbamoyladenosine biosynthesis protein TsaE n=1 Tax=Ruminococcus bovis TaxID=2564099 RepID=A0A4P8XWR9_9FIRM|nr:MULTISPECIES: tRNA (adenosine(37)-N6)-threonylcarbamoyltransferase complex ATPase subunit type 1 TsaE [Ruminococcus]MBD9121106.1 tRNA (adenosine(37)-N6)-threonylcarbamoyltransferase complex ATPase subunit type 1 TsaE [Oscillospiraceae bacterium]MEE3438633.1 tRNA (adenosine(37)-N6)-threonylcarbamoyltransferase complex ATPase subunit type 1 TsaE [Ruminococcus sp.]QCT07591.1 tRNA (adenosine(37)-N6)-threonylcarbamoyltransferase complex ATPase subunit type 1 TsaE [Ruminococcus bovis]